MWRIDWEYALPIQQSFGRSQALFLSALKFLSNLLRLHVLFSFSGSKHQAHLLYPFHIASLIQEYWARALHTMNCSTMPLSNMLPLRHDLSKANITGAREEFAGLLSPENVVSSTNERLARSDTPWSPAPPSQIAALIVFPANTAEVSAIMKICSRRQIPVTAYCGGTSFHGALTATRGGVCIDFKHMDQIIAIHPDDMDAVVQPAVGWEELNAALTHHSLYFPPDPGPGARIGGMVSFTDRSNPSITGILIDRADRHELFWHQCIPTWYHESMGHFCDFSAGRWFHRQNTASTT